MKPHVFGGLCLLDLVAGYAALPRALENLAERAIEAELEARQNPKGCSTSAVCNIPLNIPNSQIGVTGSPTPAQFISQQRSNAGQLTPITGFDPPSQYVSTTGAHAYQGPVMTDIRGPCPGLNAAANHGYLPRNGVQDIPNTITGLDQAYGMSADLAGFLAAYAVAIDGDPITQTWSIGGPAPSVPGQGISWSHNKYEGDSSISRCDAYINGGDAHSLSIQRFKYAFVSGMATDRYTFDGFSQIFAANTFRSVMTNANYFAPLFSTTLVSPAAYNFVIAMMSNHSAYIPTGYLTGDIFKTFFGVTGTYPNFVWKPGQEQIPQNWYRRPSTNPYTASTGVFGDLLVEFAAYPTSFRFGGNSNGKNSYTGVDFGNFTNGVFNSQTILEGNNLQCVLYQSLQQTVPDIATTNSFLQPYLNAAFQVASCPAINFNNNALTGYPGHTYSPTGPATNC